MRLFAGLAVGLSFSSVAAACPFCTALAPTLSQQREQADIVALAEVLQSSDDHVYRSKLHHVLSGGQWCAPGDLLHEDLDLPTGGEKLVLIFGQELSTTKHSLDTFAWHGLPVSDIAYAYLVRAPSLKTPLPERLRYFANYLEHADSLIAEDAYLEFGHAPFDQVAQAAEYLSSAKLRQWLADPAVPPERKGFYGLALGLCAGEAERRESAEFLRQQILAPANDFRAGFDGVLGGYLLLTGDEGLNLIESRYLANPKSADGDVRHALTALRFYREYGKQITPERLTLALRRLLDRPEFAADAITDLARWRDWGSVERIASLYEKPEYDRRATRLAIVGYLLACPQDDAARGLERLRKTDPVGIAAAEEILSQTGAARAKE